MTLSLFESCQLKTVIFDKSEIRATQSHELIAATMKKEAGDDWEKLKIVAAIGMSKDNLCWEELAKVYRDMKGEHKEWLDGILGKFTWMKTKIKGG